MIEKILEAAGSSRFDFREQACPGDGTRGEHAELVSCYRLQEAISRVLEPQSALLLDCRHGYGALALLRGHAALRLHGFDPNCGETAGALDWARRINSAERASFAEGGVEQLERFGDEVFDLILLRAKHDGDQSWHEIEQAARFARWIAIESYYDPACKGGFLAANEFLHRFRRDIDAVHLLPEPHGHLLFAPNPRLHHAPPEEDFHAGRRSSTELQGVYTEEYFLTDCGGYQSYRRNEGRELEDPRLEAVATIAGLRPSGRLLDIGCGRGELSYFLARRGYEVTALDYSADAIALTRSCFADDPEALARTDFVCGDATRAPLEGPFQLAVASDVVEHLMPQENDQLFARLAHLLGDDGLFVLHTYPNRWYYDREYPRRRAAAAALGGYLPPQPRSRYELIVHPNEQDPASLEAQLRRRFAHVALWVGDTQQVGGSLVDDWSQARREAAPDIFAVASNAAIDVAALVRRLRMPVLPPETHEAIRLELASPPPPELSVGDCFRIEVALRNDGAELLASTGEHPVHLAYRWLDPESGEIRVDGERSRLVPPLPAGCWDRYRLKVRAPAHAGRHKLRLTLVQEGIAWFDHSPGPASRDLELEVGAPEPGPATDAERPGSRAPERPARATDAGARAAATSRCPGAGG